jgi:hypothetical protein
MLHRECIRTVLVGVLKDHLARRPAFVMASIPNESAAGVYFVLESIIVAPSINDVD